MQKEFTECLECNTLNKNIPFGEEYIGMTKYHNLNCIYLYGIFENSIAWQITNIDTVSTPITLYESVGAAKIAQAKHSFKSPRILGFAVNTQYDDVPGNYVYDECWPEIIEYIKKLKLTEEEYKKQSGYIREIITIDRQPLIRYIINNAVRIISVQSID